MLSSSLSNQVYASINITSLAEFLLRQNKTPGCIRGQCYLSRMHYVGFRLRLSTHYRVSFRCVTREGRAASAPNRSTLFFS